MQMMGLVIAGGASEVAEINDRATASLPIAGCYEAIDFVLSSMVNSEINTVAVISQYSSRKLNNHLKDATWWNFGRKSGGLYLISPVVTPNRQTWYEGTIEAFIDSMEVVKKAHEPYVVVAFGDGIYNMNFKPVLDYHIKNEAEITMVTTKIPEKRSCENFGQVVLEGNKIVDFSEASPVKISDEISCGIYIMRRRTFIAAVEEARLAGKRDFVTEVICEKVKEGKVYSYHYDGYWNSITQPRAYYDCNMDFLKEEVSRDVFGKEDQILSKIRDSAPAKFSKDAEVSNSLIAEGAEVEGKVVDSIIFVGSKVGKGAVVRSSLILPGAVVPDGAFIEGRIFNDKPRY